MLVRQLSAGAAESNLPRLRRGFSAVVGGAAAFARVRTTGHCPVLSISDWPHPRRRFFIRCHSVSDVQPNRDDRLIGRRPGARMRGRLQPRGSGGAGASTQGPAGRARPERVNINTTRQSVYCAIALRPPRCPHVVTAVLGIDRSANVLDNGRRSVARRSEGPVDSPVVFTFRSRWGRTADGDFTGGGDAPRRGGPLNLP
jgi:hypothetical protein